MTNRGRGLDSNFESSCIVTTAQEEFETMSEARSKPVETGTDELLAEIESNVAIVTLNRPHARNALSDTLSPALRRLLPRLAADADVRALMITGAGNAFCAGGDVKGMGPSQISGAKAAPRTQEEVVADLTQRQITMTGALYAFPKPTLAALPGPAAGAGLSIALACDLRIAAESAFVTTGFGNIGLSGDYGASFFLTQLIGTARARELFFSSERVSAQRCEQLGIVNRVVADDVLRRAALAWARELAAGPTVAFGFMKQNLDRAMRTDLETCLAQEAFGLVECAGTADHKEAVRSFVEKRKPTFNGK
jgi:enoyl-CoA hydratase/carnithine racemase